jgi:hypothetical protein
MKDTEKPHMDKYKEIINDGNFDDSCTRMSLVVSNVENVKHLILIAHSVPELSVL